MEEINIEELRKDLINYFGTAMQMYPVAMMELSQVEIASEEELINIAIKNGFNLNNYITNNENYSFKR